MDLIEHTYTIQWVGPMDYEEYREYLRNQESLISYKSIRNLISFVTFVFKIERL